MKSIEDMHNILFERKMINYSRRATPSKKLTVIDYRIFVHLVYKRMGSKCGSDYKCNGRLYLLKLCYTLGIRSCLSVRNLDNYTKTISH